MGQIWHSGLFGSVDSYFSWTATDRFPGGNFLIIILEGRRSTGSRGWVARIPWQHEPSIILWTAPCLWALRAGTRRRGAPRLGARRRPPGRCPPPASRMAAGKREHWQSAHSQLTVNSQSAHSQLTVNSQSTHVKHTSSRMGRLLKPSVGLVLASSRGDMHISLCFT